MKLLLFINMCGFSYIFRKSINKSRRRVVFFMSKRRFYIPAKCCRNIDDSCKTFWIFPLIFPHFANLLHSRRQFCIRLLERLTLAAYHVFNLRRNTSAGRGSLATGLNPAPLRRRRLRGVRGQVSVCDM